MKAVKKQLDIYSSWTKSKTGNNPEMIAECECYSAKEFKAIIKKNDAVVTSRVRRKKKQY